MVEIGRLIDASRLLEGYATLLVACLPCLLPCSLSFVLASVSLGLGLIKGSSSWAEGAGVLLVSRCYLAAAHSLFNQFFFQPTKTLDLLSVLYKVISMMIEVCG